MSEQYLKAYDEHRFVSSLPWLNSIRASAKQQFSQVGFPTQIEEEWRYTNLAILNKTLFLPAVLDNNFLETECLQQHILPDVWSMVLVDGHFNAALSNLAGLPDNTLVMSMQEALVEHPEKIEAYFSQAVSEQESGLIAFNNSWFMDGVFCYIPANCQLEKPLQIIHVSTQANTMANTRHIIALDVSAQAEIIETFIGVDEHYACVAVSEIFLADNAQLTAYKMQSESDKAFHFGGLYIKQARDSQFIHHNFAFGGRVARTDVHTDLGQAASCDLNGLYIGASRQHIDNHTRIEHNQPHAVSKELYKGLLDERARAVFQGRVLVAEQAQKTDSNMYNRNLLLSDKAEIDTKPQLEIYADDVKCAHGVTVGQLDEKLIAYLQARCIDEATAKNMLTFAFANEMVEKVNNKALYKQILAKVLEKFPQKGIEADWL